VLTIKKTVNNLFGVNPFFGPNLTILLGWVAYIIAENG
jgi:hypothetical protein